MSYAIKIEKQASKALAKAPEFIREKFHQELTKAASSPRSNKPLQGMRDTYRIRAGSWRLIYRVVDEELIITVVKVGPRGDVYKG